MVAACEPLGPMRKGETTIANEKLLEVLRGLSPAALRAVIDELAKLGPPAAGVQRPPEDAPPPRAGHRR
jgi:hypothetical protein